MNAADFHELADRARADPDARSVLADALEEAGWWDGESIPGKPGTPWAEDLSLARALAEPDRHLVAVLLRVDPRRAYDVLAPLADGSALATWVVEELERMVVDRTGDPELREEASPAPFDPRWRARLPHAADFIAGLDWLEGLRIPQVPSIELGEQENFPYVLLFVGVDDVPDAERARLRLLPELLDVPGLHEISHQWGGHNCFHSVLFGILFRAPEAMEEALVDRIVEMAEQGSVGEITAADRTLFGEVGAALGLPPIAGGGEAFVYTAAGAAPDLLRGLPVVRYRARTRPWAAMDYFHHWPEQTLAGPSGERQIEALRVLSRETRMRLFVGWIWGNSD